MSTIYRKNRIFIYAYFKNGKRVRRSLRVTDRKIANVLKAQLDSDNEKLSARFTVGIKITDFLDEYDAAHLSRMVKPRTRKDVLIVLNRFIREAKVNNLDEITPEVITKWINHTTRVAKPSAKTWNNQRGYIRSFLKKAIPRYLRVNPADLIPTMRVPQNQAQFFTDEEYQAIENAASGSVRDMIIIARFTGLRINEILHLEGEDITWTKPPMIYVKNKPEWGHTVKNYNARGIPLSLGAVAKLGHLRGKTGFLFGIDGKPYIRYKENEINRVLTAAGLKEKGKAWHKFRHTFASRLLQNGAPIQNVRVWMGHSDFKMLLRYAHMAPGYSSEIEKIDLVTAPEIAPT